MRDKAYPASGWWWRVSAIFSQLWPILVSNFSDCIIVLVANEENEIVLAKMPYLSEKYSSLISGYMQVGETAEQATSREIKEELGVSKVHNLHYAGTYWFNKTETLMHGFIGYIKKQDLILSTELESAKWIPVADVPKYLFPESPDNAAFAVYRRFLEEIKAVH